MQTGGASANPSWATASGGAVNISGAVHTNGIAVFSSTSNDIQLGLGSNASSYWWSIDPTTGNLIPQGAGGETQQIGGTNNACSNIWVSSLISPGIITLVANGGSGNGIAVDTSYNVYPTSNNTQSLGKAGQVWEDFICTTITSGTYSPTFTGTNLGTFALQYASYIRIRNIIDVAVFFTCKPTTNTANSSYTANITLPVALTFSGGNFSSTAQCSGVGGIHDISALISANDTNAVSVFSNSGAATVAAFSIQTFSATTDTLQYFVKFQYQIA